MSMMVDEYSEEMKQWKSIGCPRPAGMSDEEDDEDDFSYPNEDIKKHFYFPRANLAEQEIIDYNVQDLAVERIIESRVINACIKGDLKILEEYLEKYNVNKFLYTGWTLLLYAASSVQVEVIEFLLIHGADPNMHKEGFTPLMALCNSKENTTGDSLKCLKLLIDAKADANITSRQRETALMYSCKSQDVEFIGELLKYVKDYNISDNHGKTALSYAVTYNKPDIVKILLEHNADASLTDRNNLTPKDIADAKGFTEISILLTEDDEELPISYEVAHISSWRDLLPDLYPRNKELLDYDISKILHGMGLEAYGTLFRGMDLKTFLQLTEDDLCRLGIDISVHRDQFLQNLDKFHRKKWNADSMGIIKKSVPYTIYDGAISIGNIKKQIGVIGSSFRYIKNNILKAASENIHLNSMQKTEYEEELKKTKQTLKVLKKELMNVKKLAQKIDEENIGIPASYITSPKKNKSKWILTLSITLMIGLCLSKTTYAQRLYNIYAMKT